MKKGFVLLAFIGLIGFLTFILLFKKALPQAGVDINVTKQEVPSHFKEKSHGGIEFIENQQSYRAANQVHKFSKHALDLLSLSLPRERPLIGNGPLLFNSARKTEY